MVSSGYKVSIATQDVSESYLLIFGLSGMWPTSITQKIHTSIVTSMDGPGTFQTYQF